MLCFKYMEEDSGNQPWQSVFALDPAAWHDLGKDVSIWGCLEHLGLLIWVPSLEHPSSQHLPWGPGKAAQVNICGLTAGPRRSKSWWQR